MRTAGTFHALTEETPTMAPFALAIFLGSFLLFQVQPLIGRYILPWFGGSPAVWTTCMLFFQSALLAGYAYAHGASRIGRKNQVWLHLALLLLALIFLPIAPSVGWKPSADQQPIIRILVLLAATIGVPYLVLSSTAPLSQHWFATIFPGRSPYRLYALSNISSLVALLSYPFLIEPRFTLANQVRIWSWGFAVFAICSGWCALKVLSVTRDTSSDVIAAVPSNDHSAPMPGTERTADRVTVLLWLLLSACGSAMLIASTNQLCQEIAVVPFLWVFPLVLYLATFTICFNSEKIYDRLLWGLLLIGAIIPGCRALFLGVALNLPVQIVIYLALLFTVCMTCHGELARLRPHPRQLTSYYLTMAAGGALGGAGVALVAPFLFKGFWELPLALSLSGLVILAAWFHDRAFSETTRWLPALLILGEVVLLGISYNFMFKQERDVIYANRNFYGVLRVLRMTDNKGVKDVMMHGRIVHGIQYRDSGLEEQATTYYGPQSGAGLALRLHPQRRAGSGDRQLKVGIVGLGIGTLAAYGQKGDTFRFYEINPEVIAVSDTIFRYRRNSPATLQMVQGDARVVMEEELVRNEKQLFDVLAIDAFSSDAIPIHLLTRECFSIYRQHLKPDGILLFHLTNRFLDLAPVVRANATASGYDPFLVKSKGDPEKGTDNAAWMILTSNRKFLSDEEVQKSRTGEELKTSLLWTDDFAGLWQVIKR
jgi:SAM-dependent methyltransferase